VFGLTHLRDCLTPVPFESSSSGARPTIRSPAPFAKQGNFMGSVLTQPLLKLDGY
jgi:hypothetical protein